MKPLILYTFQQISRKQILVVLDLFPDHADIFHKYAQQIKRLWDKSRTKNICSFKVTQNVHNSTVYSLRTFKKSGALCSCLIPPSLPNILIYFNLLTLII